MISIDTLQSMSHLSLIERARIIRERFDLPSLTDRALAGYYRRHNVRFKRPDYVFYKGTAEMRDLRGRQHEFVQDLGNLMMEGVYDLIYVDETTFHLW